LSYDDNLIEALICKGISLGLNYSQFIKSLSLLEKALEISKRSMVDNSSIFYWIGHFYNEIKKYDKSLLIIGEGLNHYPGDKYLLNLKLRTLLIASEHNNSYEYDAIEMLQDIRQKYPNSLHIKIELLKVLKRKRTNVDLLPLITESFMVQNYNVDPETIKNMSIDEIIFILENLKSVSEFREENDLCGLFFAEYDISISKAKKIEMKANFLFSLLNSKMHFSSNNDLLTLFEQHIKSFLELNEYCTEILVIGLENATADEKANKVSHIIISLPEILLKELSRENGWLLQKHGYPIENADEYFISSSLLRNWFELCLEPILKGANNVLKWSKEDLEKQSS
jgi:tetratricopeptide (TPR) repeat protein